MDRYSNIKKILNTNENVGTLGTPYYKNALYPEIPLNPNDIYVITDWGDRLDLLANQFYGDVTLYWVIAAANPNITGFSSLYVKEGTQMRIPVDINEIIRSFNILNNK